MSLNKAYILTIEKGNILTSYNSKKFHEQITTAKGIKTWWHYIDNTYILIVESSILAKNITDYVMPLIPKRRFFVCELDLRNHNGWLPQEAWDWIKKQKDDTKNDSRMFY